MTRKATLLPMVVLGAAVALIVAAYPDETEEAVTIDQVPAAVKATILKESAGGKITEIEHATKNGTTVYEAEFVLNGQEIEIKIAPDGTLLGREVENEGDDDDDLKLEQIPEPARAALLKLVGDGKITEIEREREQGVVIYEAAWDAGGAMHEAAVMADGTLLETEERIKPDQAPPAVRALIAKHFAGVDKVVIEKKMIVVYEAEAKVNGKEVELLMLPTGQVIDEPGDDQDPDGDDDGDDD